MKYIKLLALSMMLLVSYSLLGLVSKSHSASTNMPGDQIIAYYNTDETAFTLIQFSNVDFANAVFTHIQVLDSACGEVNFPWTLTPGDTDIMVLESGAITIDGVPAPAVAVLPTHGIVVITAVEAPGSLIPASSGGSLMATSSLVFVKGADIMHTFNGVTRTLGANGEFEVIQPTDILSPFHIFDDGDSGGSEFVAAAWTDLYLPEYVAITGTAATDPFLGLNIIDDKESPVSCGDFSFECVIAAGVTLALPSLLDIPGTENIVCDKSTQTKGLVDLNALVVSDNMIALEGMYRDGAEENGGMDYVVVVDAQEVTPPPVEVCDGTPTSCFEDPLCADNTGLCASLGEILGGQAAVNCNDFDPDTGEPIDNDGNGQANCADFKCDTVMTVDGTCQFGIETNCTDGFDNDANGLTDCADTGFCSTDEECDTGGGGGGSCSIATGSVGLANALILLVPVFGIGFRRIRRRLSK